MASDWMLQDLQGSRPASAPRAVTPTVPSTPAPIAPSAPAQTPAPTQTTPQGKFFSGNLIQKAFDIPMLPSYAISGFQKGAYEEKARQNQTGEVDSQSYGSNILNRLKAGVKGILPGIQNRVQPGTEAGNVNLGKEVGIKSNTGQAAYNFATSLAHPNLAVGKIPGVKQAASAVSKGVGKVADIARKSEPLAKGIEGLAGIPFLGDKLEYFRNPEAGKILEQGAKEGQARVSGLFNKINDAAKGLKPDQLEEVGRLIENQGTTSDPKLIAIADYMKAISDKVGQELVDLGVMKPETFAKYKGGYLSHIADIVKNTEQTGNRGTAKLPFSLNSLKERKNILGAEGKPDYIRQFQFPTFKAIGGEMQTAESTRALKELSGKFGKTVEEFSQNPGGPRVTADGMVALSDILPDRIGKMFHKVAVPPEVADYVRKRYAKTDPSVFQRAADKAIGYWKAGKTIVNPAYHSRNMISNLMLSDMSTGEGLAKTLYGFGDAVKTYLGHGSPEMTQYLQELKDIGVVGRQTFAKGIEEMNPKTFQKGKSVGEKILDAPFKFQNANEEASKLNVYSYWRSKGLDIKDAAAKAQEAIFSPYNVNQTEKSAVKNIIPFYSFTRQALPFTAKTLANNPERMTKYAKLKTGVESLSPGETGQNNDLPESAKGQIRTPIKDKYGRSIYADPTYIYPFGNFQEAGFSKGQLPFGLSINPFLSETMAQTAGPQGYDPYFGQPIAKSNIPEEATAQRVAHATRTIAPTLLSTAQQLYSAYKGKTDYAGRERNLPQAVLNAIGLKSASYDPAEQRKFDNIRKREKIKSINSQIQSIAKNQSFSVEEKTKKVQRLQEIRRQLISGQ